MTTAAALEAAGWMLRAWALVVLGLGLAFVVVELGARVVERLRGTVAELRARRAVDAQVLELRRHLDRWPAL